MLLFVSHHLYPYFVYVFCCAHLRETYHRTLSSNIQHSPRIYCLTCVRFLCWRLVLLMIYVSTYTHRHIHKHIFLIELQTNHHILSLSTTTTVRKKTNLPHQFPAPPNHPPTAHSNPQRTQKISQQKNQHTHTLHSSTV